VGVENGRWKKGSTELAKEYDFSVDGRTEVISYIRDVVLYHVVVLNDVEHMKHSV